MSERITIEELRALTQPESVRMRANAEHWVAYVYLRKFSPYLTRILIRMNFSPNAVTWLMIVTGFSAALALLIPGMWGVTLALLLGQLQMLWDCCDGEIARWRKQFSPAGIFLDKLGHYLAEAFIPICFGLRLANWPNEPINSTIYPYFGALLAILIILNKGFNDAVHVARAFSGLAKIQDQSGANLPVKGILRSIRKVFNFLPAQRIFHSVEFTIYVALFSSFTQSLQVALGIALFVTVGHIAAIVTSAKLRGE